jgi:hypothetical protein
MFTYEWYLAILKSYVQNRVHLKGSIMEGYTIEEVVECCIDYVKDEKRIGLSIPLHEGRLRGRGRMCQKSFVDSDYNSVIEADFSKGGATRRGVGRGPIRARRTVREGPSGAETQAQRGRQRVGSVGDAGAEQGRERGREVGWWVIVTEPPQK